MFIKLLNPISQQTFRVFFVRELSTLFKVKISSFRKSPLGDLKAN